MTTRDAPSSPVPDDPAAQRVLIVSLLAKVAILEEQLRLASAERFARKSEKFTSLDQLNLFNEAEASAPEGLIVCHIASQSTFPHERLVRILRLGRHGAGLYLMFAVRVASICYTAATCTSRDTGPLGLAGPKNRDGRNLPNEITHAG